ncbi:MAG: class I SAM-dependent methyltransferase [Saprospiraceae bacterium]|nr:class I SAM-dependent methyltransferase [Saprospiraceae bacterium]
MQNKRAERLYPNLVSAVVAALQQIFEEGKYADRVIEKTLKSNKKWGSRDRAFIAESVYEIVRWYRLLYAIVGKRPRNSQEWWHLFGVWKTIRGVNLPDWKEFDRIDGRKILKQHADLQAIRAIRESIPEWMDEMGVEQLGDKWDGILTALNRPAKVVLRTNLLKVNANQLADSLQAEGVALEAISEEAFVVQKRKNLFTTDAFKNGWFEVQDFSSQQVAHFLEVQPGMRVIDACAGAGGKTLHLGVLMANKGQIIGMDTEAWKLKELKRRAKRNGIFIIQPKPIDSTKVIKRQKESADRLLLDVPCSGLGVLRRNPDAKWKLQAEFLEKIRGEQANIISNYSKMLKKGGKMVYATCSVLPSENQAQVQRFLEQHGDDFVLEEERSISPEEGYDGFYMARLVRR